MLYKLFNFLAGLFALICPIAFFLALLFFPMNSIEESVALKVSLFSFAMAFTFGLAAAFQTDVA
jgi:hypothetical protein